jgi:hypothetical protein
MGNAYKVLVRKRRKHLEELSMNGRIINVAQDRDEWRAPVTIE